MKLVSKKLLGRLFAVTIALVVVAAIAGTFWLRSSLPNYDGSQVVQGARDTVRIVRDEYAVPHVFANNFEDMYFGLGFVHAQDRLWQIETYRRVSQGRLSQLIGPDGLPIDKLVRALNPELDTAAALSRLDPEAQQVLKSYAAGINAYLAGHDGATPPEFVLLGAEPEPWSVDDLLKLPAIITLGMSNWQKELLNARVEKRLGSERLSELLPGYASDGAISYQPPAPEQESKAGKEHQRYGAWGSAISSLRGFASNTWAVHGARTASGKPLLASDPHGGLSAPTDYYLVRLVSPSFEIIGASFPGIPAFMAGRNNTIAWGVTDMTADISDLYMEKLIDAEHYLTPAGPEPFKLRDVSIPVKGGEPVSFKVRETRHGPVISDVVDEAARTAALLGEDIVLALSAPMLNTGDFITQSMLRMNRAENWDEFVAAMSIYSFGQNFSYADLSGNIGLVSASRIPMRRAGHDGLTPAPGWTDQHDGQDVIPFDELPSVANPPAGYVFNTNNALEPEGYPHVLSRSYAPAHRANRLVELLGQEHPHTMETMKSAQGDVMSLEARELLQYLLEVKPESELAKQALNLLKDWDGAMERGLTAPLIFAAWTQALGRAVYADDLDSDFDEFAARTPLMTLANLQGGSKWCDDMGTPAPESCQEILSATFEKTLTGLAAQFGSDMTSWTWGEGHKARFSHQIFGGIPVLSMFSDPTIAAGGGTRTLNNTAVDYSSDSCCEASYGSRYRQIIDLADVNQSLFMIGPGVSGNLLSPYYDNLLKAWRDQEYFPLTGNADEVARQGIGDLTLTRGPSD